MYTSIDNGVSRGKGATRFFPLFYIVFFMILPMVNAGIALSATPQIAGGGWHTVVLKSNGTLWAWGLNSSGQLGVGTRSQQHTTPVQVGIDDNWVSVSAGDSHTIALRSDGTLWAWGHKGSGALGIGDNNNWDPVTSPVQVGSDNTWVQVATGCFHTVAIKSDGTLWTWGANNEGQLGDGTTTLRASPMQVGAENTWAMVTAGYTHTVALKSDGTLWAWGWNKYGQLGDGTTTRKLSPVQIGLENTWVMVTAGRSHTVALKSDGTLWAWGGNTYGMLGDGTTTQRNSPTQIGTENKWVTIKAGRNFHTLAIKADRTLWAWGNNARGELGDGTTTQRNSPVQIEADRWIVVAVGQNNTIAIKSDGIIWMWGQNTYGQIGDGTLTDRWSPVQITPTYE